MGFIFFSFRLLLNKNCMIKVTSSVFSEGEEIPQKYSCDGENIHPPLTIEGVPAEAQSLVIIMDDPDAPQGTFTHWLLWNLEPTVQEIEENVDPEDAVYGENDAGQVGYAGPCPPSGTHRYFFKVYALDNFLDIPHDSTRQELEKYLEGHIIDEGELVGKYTR